ncbi:unnamed protein product [Colias eurytheme]|nr:unnamed protein product [Colias eurytheme]
MDEQKRDKLMYDIHALVYNSNYNEFQSSSNSTPVYSNYSAVLCPNTDVEYSYNDLPTFTKQTAAPTSDHHPKKGN